MSERQYWEIVNDLVTAGHDTGRPRHEVREEIVHRVHQAHADGEQWASEVLMRWERNGADEDYGGAHKNLNTTTYIRADGRRVRKTVSYSRPVRSAVSGEIVGQQLQAWWHYSRAQLVELRRDMATQERQLADVVQAIGQLIDAMDRHPECETAREAWEADGRSVDEIDLGGAA